jgi:hypothetical protein
LLAFGFVYIHPFEDGNGRIHRYLIHHLLAQRGFNPPGVVFPVSAAILEQIDEYQSILEDYSERLLPVIDWEPTDDGNVRVLNDTGDFYRFFDATPHAEFLYACVRKTIEEDLPSEADFLRRYDLFRDMINRIVDMPDATISRLFHFLRLNEGRLSKRARAREFNAFSDEEAKRVEAIYDIEFGPPLQSWPPICDKADDGRHRIPGVMPGLSDNCEGWTYQGYCVLCGELIDTCEPYPLTMLEVFADDA